jgi:hypothetical protein
MPVALDLASVETLSCRSPMRSVPLACAVVVSHVVFSLTIAFGAPCIEECPDDGPDGRCPPACMTCPCSPRPARTGPALVLAAPATAGLPLAAVVVLPPCEPEPADIFHVPKSLLA